MMVTAIQPRRRPALQVAVAALIITLMVGCSSITETRRRTAETARVTVTGSSTVPLTLITSTQFTILTNPDGDEMVNLLAADTAQLDLPIDHSVQFGTSDRFFVMLSNPDKDVTATVDMRVLVDGQEVYRQAATLREASLAFRYTLF